VQVPTARRYQHRRYVLLAAPVQTARRHGARHSRLPSDGRRRCAHPGPRDFRHQRGVKHGRADRARLRLRPCCSRVQPARWTRESRQRRRGSVRSLSVPSGSVKEPVTAPGIPGAPVAPATERAASSRRASTLAMAARSVISAGGRIDSSLRCAPRSRRPTPTRSVGLRSLAV
jgi:hypothetical protein